MVPKLLFVLLLATLIFVHELGHFLMAKLFGVKVLKFSLGFGPKLLAFTWGETEYRISALPLGGYVKMAGDDPTDESQPEADKGRGFLEQKPWKRALIALAGPASNLVFPVLVYFLAFWIQPTDYSNLVGIVEPDRPAFAAGLRPGDRITSIDGTPVRYFGELRELIAPKWEKKVAITFERGGKPHTVELVPDKYEEKSLLGTDVRGLLGIQPLYRAPVVGVSDPASPAGKAGIATFDRIVKVGEEKIVSYPQLASRLAALAGPVEVTVVRDVPEGGAAGALTSYKTFTATLAPEQREGESWLGIEPTGLFVFSVEQGSPAWEAGLRRGDKLLEANGKPLHGWGTFEIERSKVGEKEPLAVAWMHEGQRVERAIQQKSVVEKDRFDNEMPRLLFGVSPDERASSYGEGEKVPIDVPAGKAFARAMRVVPDEIGKTVLGIWMLVSGQLSSKNIGGPIMMYKAATEAAAMGGQYFLQMMGFISINLGLVNLIPIPVLDGFHILSAGVETVRRRPLGLKARIIANYIGLAMLLMLMLLAIKNDIFNFVLN